MSIDFELRIPSAGTEMVLESHKINLTRKDLPVNFGYAERIRRIDDWHPLTLRAAEGPKDTIGRLGLRSGQRNRLFRQPKWYMTRLQMSESQIPTAGVLESYTFSAAHQYRFHVIEKKKLYQEASNDS